VLTGPPGIGKTRLAEELADGARRDERTVEGHVRNTLAKLQPTNRTELAAWALRDAGA